MDKKVDIQRGSALARRVNLVFRLMRDRRVPFTVKLIPLAAVFYFVWPWDLAVGPIDDVVVMWMALNLFVELSPSDVVAEIQEQIDHPEKVTKVKPKPKSDSDTDEVIDGKFEVKNGK